MNSSISQANPWHQVEMELLNSKQARNSGNEGKARVCARRAVGLALLISGIAPSRALSAIQSLTENQNIPEEIRLLALPLLEKVDENHLLESGFDLIDCAQKIVTFVQNINMDYQNTGTEN